RTSCAGSATRRAARCWPLRPTTASAASARCLRSAHRRTRSRRIRSTPPASRSTRWSSGCASWWRGGDGMARRAEARMTAPVAGDEVIVDLGLRSYPILVGEHVLGQVGSRVAALGYSGRCAVVTSEHVGTLYRDPVLESLRGAGFDPVVVE